jgi:hypothetical protein
MQKRGSRALNMPMKRLASASAAPLSSAWSAQKRRARSFIRALAVCSFPSRRSCFSCRTRAEQQARRPRQRSVGAQQRRVTARARQLPPRRNPQPGAHPHEADAQLLARVPAAEVAQSVVVIVPDEPQDQVGRADPFRALRGGEFADALHKPVSIISGSGCVRVAAAKEGASAAGRGAPAAGPYPSGGPSSRARGPGARTAGHRARRSRSGASQ